MERETEIETWDREWEERRMNKKNIISFYNCATVPSQICDGTVAQF